MPLITQCKRLSLILLTLAVLPAAADAQTFTKKQTVYALNPVVDDFTLGGGEPESGPESARIHELLDRKGNVRLRYLHVEGTQGDDFFRVRTGNTKTGEMLVVEFSTSVDGADVFLTFEFPEHDVSDIDDIRLFGLAGDDTIRNQTSVPAFIFGGLGNDIIRGGDGPSWLFGQDGDDRLDGEGGNDVVLGEEGDDDIVGGDGVDLVAGGPGSDQIAGGSFPWDGIAPVDDGDEDTLTGGSGPDAFWLTNAEDDEITDFNAAEDSQITE